jgi:hypothetical protein
MPNKLLQKKTAKGNTLYLCSFGFNGLKPAIEWLDATFSLSALKL